MVAARGKLLINVHGREDTEMKRCSVGKIIGLFTTEEEIDENCNEVGKVHGVKCLLEKDKIMYNMIQRKLEKKDSCMSRNNSLEFLAFETSCTIVGAMGGGKGLCHVAFLPRAKNSNNCVLFYRKRSRVVDR